ncbi:alpha/beta hydrolase family protein [Mesorhizobium sp. 1B3]|uniref:alpha/beta hydrolase family protein n=1 Tax=Mesorhizobium sp. 1B3 TaxID=3243599 RepID=UPI003D96FB3E
MYEYFDKNYAWNLTAVTLIEEVGTITQPAEAFEAAAPFQDSDPVEASVAWHDAMVAMGENLERYAERDLADGHGLTASRKFHRAAMFFIRAERIMSHDDPRQMAAYRRAIANYRKAREHAKDGVEFIEIPFEDGMMPGLLVKAEDVQGKPAPIVIHIQGFDSIKETQFPMFQEYRRRGLSILIMDQPGAGGAIRLHGLKARHDSETYVSKIVDWIKKRPDLATDRIGLQGISLGGYFAPRAAAFEPRIRAVACWGALFDWPTLWAKRLANPDDSHPSVTNPLKHAMWTFGTGTQAELLGVIQKMTLAGVVERIDCPLLVIHGENDRQVPVSQAQETYDRAKMEDKTLKIFTKKEGGAEHCQIDNRAIAADYVSDWFASRLVGRPD